MIIPDTGSLTVKVRPGAKKTCLVSQEDGVYRIDVKAQAEGGRANLELIRFVEKSTGKDARIVKGKTSRTKTIVLTDRQRSP